MNEKIFAELYEKALIITSGDGYVSGELDPVKFAELIVKECAMAANDWYMNHHNLHWDPYAHVTGHFGVE